MSDQSSGLFSESQLSQIAAMSPAFASKSKIEAGVPELATSNRAVPPVQSGAAENFGATSDETKEGILRLADFINRKKKSKKQSVDAPPLKIKTFNFAPLPAELLRRGLDTYGWVEDHKSLAIGTCINKYF